MAVIAYRFGPFRLCVSGRILERDGERMQLTPKAIDTLFVLVRNARQVVAKEALISAVWPDVTVVESGLTRNISALRKVLEDGEPEGSYIETIPRRGYRFVAEVHEETEAAAVSPLPAPPPQPPARKWWPGGIALACMLLAAFAILVRSGKRGPEPVNPAVRIGEHLLYKLAPAETIRASEHFEQAIAADPSQAGAHAGLAISLIGMSSFGLHPMHEIVPRAEKAAARAIELAPESSAAHFAMAMIYMFRDWDFRGADAEFRQALSLDPESVQARLGYARLKIAVDDLNSARALVEDALRLDPASPALGAEYCRIFYFLRDFHRAASECRKVLDRESGYALAHYYLALTLGYLGRFEEAARSLDRSGLVPGVVEADRAWLALRQGDRRPALSVLEERRALMRQGVVDASAKLLLACSLNNMDEAYEAVEASLSARAPELMTLTIEPRLDALRTDPRYPDVLRRLGIP